MARNFGLLTKISLMPDNDDEIRLDKTERAAGEPDMPGDNTVKTSDRPASNLNQGFAANANLTQASDPALDSSPDFSSDESSENTVDKNQ